MLVEHLKFVFVLLAEECCIKNSFLVCHKIDSKGKYNSNKKNNLMQK